MEKAEIMEKINKIINKEVDQEIFYKVRPPEEFGDAVKLFLNGDQTLKAIVFDPDTLIEFYERKLSDVNSTCLFISNVLEGKSLETNIEYESNQPEY